MEELRLIGKSVGNKIPGARGLSVVQNWAGISTEDISRESGRFFRTLIPAMIILACQIPTAVVRSRRAQNPPTPKLYGAVLAFSFEVCSSSATCNGLRAV